MARRRQPANAEEIARADLGEEIERMIDRLALAEGPPPDSSSVSDAKQLQQWGQRDPKVTDPDGMMRQLMETGLGQFPEMLDPNSPTCLAIVKANPEIAQMYTEPVDEQLADMLCRLAEFPLRLGVLAPYADDPEELVRFAKRMDARWQKSLGIVPAEADPTIPDAMPEAVAAPLTPPAPPMAPEMPQAPAMAPDPALIGG